jgi:hypothetical protein
MPEPDRIVGVVESLAASGSAAFRASAVANELHAGVPEVVPTLAGMVESGDLKFRFDLLGPDGRTIQRYESQADIPFNEEIKDDRYDEPVYVSPTDIWVMYVPTTSFLQRTLRKRDRETKSEGASGDPPGLLRRLRPKTHWPFRGHFST